MVSLARFLPFITRFKSYRRGELNGDLLAGVIVAIVLIPQAMAYALIAGLPPQIGLYASILPIFIYSFFGSSNFLAVGPVAIVSLMVASAIADAGAAGFIGSPVVYALVLALMSGVFLLAMGVARLGFFVNFISHPVIIGFTSAAAILIGLSQLKHFVGVDVPRAESGLSTIPYIVNTWQAINWYSTFIGVFSVGILLLTATWLPSVFHRFTFKKTIVTLVEKIGPLIVVAASIVLMKAARLDVSENVKIIGNIPAGLPEFAWVGFELDLFKEFMMPALIIALVGFMESISVAKAFASKRRQKVDPNQELIALGLANIGSSFSGGYPVTGGFSRSAVNYAAGANSALASIITACTILITTLFFTSWFYLLPKSVLAAIIIVAVIKLIDVKKALDIWRFNKADGLSLIISFVCVLGFGIEVGILLGVLTSICLFIYRASTPHIAVLGRLGESEHFRNIKHFPVQDYPDTQIVRIDESLFFANARYLENLLLSSIADNQNLKQIILVCSAINSIDSSALETLENSILELKEAGVLLHLAEVKVPVMESLKRTKVLSHLKPGCVYLSTHDAIQAVSKKQN